jgi:uncharacterized membrane protein HdeD (DUF308 family)
VPDVTQQWKVSVAIGLLGIVAGLVLVVWPEIVLGIAVVVYGAYSIALGVVDGAGVLMGHTSGAYSKWLLLALAALNVVVGILLVTATQKTMAVVLAIAGVVIVLEGTVRLVRVVRSGMRGLPLWVNAAAAVCELLVGVWFALRPLAASVASVALLGGLLLAVGVFGLGAGLASRASQGYGDGPTASA